MASPNSVMRVPLPPTPPVFESSVLASRFISWSRKSSFLPTSPPAGQQLAEVPDVRGHARQLLGNVAALHQHGNLLEQPLAVELRAGGRQQPLGEPLLVALLDLGAQRGHAVGCLGQPVERAVQNRLQRLALARAHGLQLVRAAARSASARFRSARPGPRRARLSACNAPGRRRTAFRSGSPLESDAPRAPRQRRPDSRPPVRGCSRPSAGWRDRRRSVRSTWPRTRLSLSALRSSISSASRPGGRRNCTSRKR